MSDQAPVTHPYSNKLLRILSVGDRELLQRHLEPIELERDKDLEEPKEPVRYVYFPESGIASAVGGTSGVNNDRPIEVGLIGREGVTGIPLILGNHHSTHSIYMQVAGHGHRISGEAFRNAITASRTLHWLLLKFVQVFMTQITQTAVANGRSKIEERLARWVLMADDRVDAAGLPLTHEFLSIMLGVRRAGVTDAIHALAGRGLIRSDRGNIHVIDREGLLDCANGCYGMPESEYRRLFDGDGTDDHRGADK
jgi:CRP-like cAMP-binding protein